MSDPQYRIQDEELIRGDIAAYLRKHETKDLLRMLTCGSVDDGKSTMIGRGICVAGDVTAEYLQEVEMRRNDAAKQMREAKRKGQVAGDAGETTDAAVGM